jgi:hypothetical protein
VKKSTGYAADFNIATKVTELINSASTNVIVCFSNIAVLVALYKVDKEVTSLSTSVSSLGIHLELVLFTLSSNALAYCQAARVAYHLCLEKNTTVIS